MTQQTALNIWNNTTTFSTGDESEEYTFFGGVATGLGLPLWLHTGVSQYRVAEREHVVGFLRTWANAIEGEEKDNE